MKHIFSIALFIALAGCAHQRPTSEACNATDEAGYKSAECAGALAIDGTGAALDIYNLLDLVTLIAR